MIAWCRSSSSRQALSPSSAARSVELTMSVKSTVARTGSGDAAREDARPVLAELDHRPGDTHSLVRFKGAVRRVHAHRAPPVELPAARGLTA